MMISYYLYLLRCNFVLLLLIFSLIISTQSKCMLWSQNGTPPSAHKSFLNCLAISSSSFVWWVWHFLLLSSRRMLRTLTSHSNDWHTRKKHVLMYKFHELCPFFIFMGKRDKKFCQYFQFEKHFVVVVTSSQT